MTLMWTSCFSLVAAGRAVKPKTRFCSSICAPSICTGSGVLAAAGLLDGRRATSNKQSFAWASSCGSAVTWVAQARWVTDGNIYTAGGVAAGIDMSLALIARILSEDVASEVARYAEYDWHRDAAWDPFAEQAGLL